MIQNNFWRNVIWHTQSMATLLLLWRLAESDITPTISHMYGLITLVI